MRLWISSRIKVSEAKVKRGLVETFGMMMLRWHNILLVVISMLTLY
jgi:hypothetical protein